MAKAELTGAMRAKVEMIRSVIGNEMANRLLRLDSNPDNINEDQQDALPFRDDLGSAGHAEFDLAVFVAAAKFVGGQCDFDRVDRCLSALA